MEFELDEIVSVSEEGIMDVCVRIFPNEFEFDRAVTYNLVIVEEGATATISGKQARSQGSSWGGGTRCG